MIVDVAVITPSLVSRRSMLLECMASVAAQTWQPKAHAVSVDYERIRPAATCNRLIAGLKVEWLVMLADDDLLYPLFVQRLLENVDEDTALIYPFCDVEGRDWWEPNAPFDPERLRQGPYIPGTVMIRREALMEIGGFNEEVTNEDYDAQLRLLNAGYKIKNVPEILWRYRIHGSNISNGIDYREV